MRSQSYSPFCVQTLPSNGNASALFYLEDGATTAKRPQHHPTWRRANSCGEIEHDAIAALMRKWAPDFSQTLPENGLVDEPHNANVHHLVSSIFHRENRLK
jgi:hypothetical protein